MSEERNEQPRTDKGQNGRGGEGRNGRGGKGKPAYSGQRSGGRGNRGDWHGGARGGAPRESSGPRGGRPDGRRAYGRDDRGGSEGSGRNDRNDGRRSGYRKESGQKRGGYRSDVQGDGRSFEKRPYRGGKPSADKNFHKGRKPYSEQEKGFHKEDRPADYGKGSGDRKPYDRTFRDEGRSGGGKDFGGRKRYDDRRGFGGRDSRDGGKFAGARAPRDGAPYGKRNFREGEKPYREYEPSGRKAYEKADRGKGDDFRSKRESENEKRFDRDAKPDARGRGFSDKRGFDERPRRYEGKPYGWRPRDAEGNPIDEELYEAEVQGGAQQALGDRDERGSVHPPDGEDTPRSFREHGDRSGEGRRNDRRGGGRWGDDRRDGNGGRSRGERGDDRREGERRGRVRFDNERRFDVSPARKAALKVGRMIRERDAFAQDLIAAHIDGSRMSREDRAFATKLVLGVVSAKGTLDEIIDRCLNSPDDVQDDVRDALRISVYEIYFLGKQPHAAVDEGVELVRTFAPKACGVANFALRKASSMKEEFPFGNPKADLNAFARQYAFPVWLVRRLVADLGLEAACDFMEASNEPAPLFVAVNPALATDEEVRDELAAAHGDPEPVETAAVRAARLETAAAAAVEAASASSEGAPSKPADPERALPTEPAADMPEGETLAGCYRLSSGRVLQDGRIKRMINQGKLFVSDASSQEIARLALSDAAPASLLEVGAGRGTKTLLLQGNALRLHGAQVADYETLDNREYKTSLLEERAQTYGVNVAQAHTGDATKLDEVLPGREFDVVFVDAPCSGLGTLRRHPEIRWRLSEQSIATLAKESLDMLKSAAAHVSVGGTLVYSTCTVTHAENNGVVMAFLKSPEGKGFKLAPMGGKSCFVPRLQPGTPDAHFAVKMVRTA